MCEQKWNSRLPPKKQVEIERTDEDTPENVNPPKSETPEDVIIEGFWINQLPRLEAEEIVWENKEEITFFHEYENEIMLESAIIESRIEEIA